MAALDFPTSPANGDKYPVPAVAGLPIYTWDGEKWTTVGGSVISGTPSNALPLMDNTPAVAGAATNYTREDHVHPVDTKAVRSDVATLWTPAQQQLARQNAYAAPFDAMMMGGLQINGGMEVSQEKGAALTVTANSYIIDGWKLVFAGAMVPSAGNFTNAMFPGFPWLLFVSITTAQASMGASDYLIVQQLIEGWRCSRLQWGTANAQPVTIGFWSNHHRTGIYSVSIKNGANNRSYVSTYTHAAADVPQYNTVTIPGDAAGAWATDNTIGLQLNFPVAQGSNGFAPSLNSWQSGNYTAASGQVNAAAATSDQFRITGITVHPGNEAPSAARSPFVMRPYDQELLQCWRYYERINQLIYRSPPNYYWLPARVQKRVVPTVSFANASYSGTSTPTGANIKVDGAEINFAGTGYIFTDVAFDARL